MGKNLAPSRRRKGESLQSFIERRASDDPAIAAKMSQRSLDGPTDRKTFDREYAAEQREPLTNAERALEETQRQMAEVERQWARDYAFAQPDPNLECSRINRLALRDGQGQFLSESAMREVCLRAADQALAVLKTEGIELTPLGRTKMDKYLGANLRDLTFALDLRLAATWRQVYDRMVYLDLFGPRGRIVTKTFVTTKAPTFEERLASINASTREGEKAARELVQEFAHEEWYEVHRGWLRVLADKLKFYPTKEQQTAAINVFRELNLNLMDPRDYDKVRYELVRRGVFPMTALEPMEKLNLFDMPQWLREHPGAPAGAYRFEYKKRENAILYGTQA